MSENRNKAKKNVIFLSISQIVTIAFGLLMPRLTIAGYGSEVNGLINSVTQVISYLALFEAGIQSVAKKSLYKTIGGNNQKGTNSILSAVNVNYRKIGILYFIFLCGLSSVYPFFVDSENLNFISVFLIVFFSGFGNVVTFFFQGKYQILLSVDGKTYVLSLISTSISLINHIVKILMLYYGIDILLIVTMTFLISMIQCLFILGYVKKKYGWVDLTEEPNFDCLKQSKYAFVHQVSAQIFSHIDVLLLTVFCGLKVVSVYSIYKMIVNYIRTVLVIPWDSSYFALGQLYNKDRNGYTKVADTIELLLVTAVFSVFTVTMSLSIPFISVYTRGITDINYIDVYLLVLFVFGESLNIIRAPMNSVISFEGHFKETMWRSILETVINLVTSIIGVLYLGIYGVLIGTIVALLYRTTDIVIYANKKILKRSPFKTFSMHAINITLFLGVGFLINCFNITVSSYFDFIKVGVIVTPMVIVVFFAALLLIFKNERSVVIDFVKGKFIHNSANK